MIKVSNLTKEFDHFKAVNNISFEVPEGETLVLLGTSGCGKTTTLKMINRLIEPTGGSVFINEQNIKDQSPEILRRKIGYVIQNIGLFPHYTVAQNVAVVPKLLKWDSTDINNRARELLDLVGLPPDDYMARFPDELSGGQKQRVGLARALASDPPVVLLDEPFGALDPITRREVQEEFKNLETFLHKTMVLVSHDVFEAFDLGDRVCLMDAGKVQQIGTAKKLIFEPENDFVRNFFKANRFQLELKVLTLDDILSVLPSPGRQDGNIIDFKQSETLLDVFEQLENSSAENPIVNIVDDSDQSTAKTTYQDILTAFHKVKNQIKHKGS